MDDDWTDSDNFDDQEEQSMSLYEPSLNECSSDSFDEIDEGRQSGLTRHKQRKKKNLVKNGTNEANRNNKRRKKNLARKKPSKRVSTGNTENEQQPPNPNDNNEGELIKISKNDVGM